MALGTYNNSGNNSKKDYSPTTYSPVKFFNSESKVDPSAFMLITDAAEVIGQGFTKPINPTNVEEKLAEEYEKSLHDTRDSEMSSK